MIPKFSPKTKKRMIITLTIKGTLGTGERIADDEKSEAVQKPD